MQIEKPKNKSLVRYSRVCTKHCENDTVNFSENLRQYISIKQRVPRKDHCFDIDSSKQNANSKIFLLLKSNHDLRKKGPKSAPLI